MYSNRKTIRIALITIAVVLFSSDAMAGGLEVPDLGTVAIGRGTAFVARADNLSAFYYNPAGLSKSTGPDLLLSANVVHMKLDFQRSGTSTVNEWGQEVPGTITIDGEEITNPHKDYSHVDYSDDVRIYDPEDFKSVSLGKNIGPAPMLVFNYGNAFNVEGLALSIGVLPPSSFGTPHYPEDGPQRYAMQDAHFLMMFPGVGVSYAFNRYIQVGGVFLSGMGFFEQSLAIRPVPVLDDPFYNGENLRNDATLSVDVKDLFMPTGIIGVMSNPLDWLEIGASVRLPIKVEASGTAEYVAPEGDLPESRFVEGEDKVTMGQHFPWLVRVGARYIHRYFDIEADFVWENWSSLKEFEIDMEANLLQEEGGAIVPMPDSAVPKHFRDTYSVRLGGDVEVWPEHIAVRVGGYYQSSAYPEDNRTFNLDFPFAEQIGVGGGLTWHVISWLDVNVGYLHVFQLDVEVDEGIVQQQGLLNEDEKNIGNTVNNGKYQVAMNLLGISLEGHF